MTETNGAEKPKSSKRLRLALVLSLAVNLLVVGAVAGAFWSHDKKSGHHRGGYSKMGGPLTRALSEDDQKEVRKKLHALYKQHETGHAAYKSAKKDLIVVLTAEPFDPEAARAHMIRMREIVAKRVELGREVLIDHLSEMTPEDRKALAERLQKRRKHHKH